jgi:quercetin dioxygenase-like cupin family protein
MKRKTTLVKKGWGCEKIIHNSDGYCGKILCFKKGKKCSFHYHKLKTETFYCVGKVIVRYGYVDFLSKSKKVILKTGDVFHVPVGMRHQVEAIEDSELFEFSTKDFPKDSIRILKGD